MLHKSPVLQVSKSRLSMADCIKNKFYYQFYCLHHIMEVFIFYADKLTVIAIRDSTETVKI